MAQASASAASGDGSPGSASSADHVLHLLLAGVAVAHDRLLHLQRGVLGDREAGQHRRADRRAARLAERERRLGIDVDEHLLDRDLDGPCAAMISFRPSRIAFRRCARSPSPDFTQPLVT
jgi:hypothetical protein